MPILNSILSLLEEGAIALAVTAALAVIIVHMVASRSRQLRHDRRLRRQDRLRGGGCVKM